MHKGSYSIDLREKVINFLEMGNTQRETSKVFNLSKTTINKWYLRYKNEGHYLPRKHLGAKPKIIKENFSNYVMHNLNATSEDIGKAFGISSSGARYWLRAIGFSYKKKPSPMWRRIKKSGVNI